MAPLSLNDLIERNKKYAASHQPLPTFPEIAELKIEPPQIIIVSCADPRVIPENFFQLCPGECIIMRNVAGHPQHCLNDIVALDAFLDITDIVVVHHTDCGSTYWTNDFVRSKVKERLPNLQGVESMQFGAVTTSLEQSVIDDLEFIRNSELIRKELADRSHGFLYDIKTGKLLPLGDSKIGQK